MLGGVQTVSLQAGGCTYVGTVAHELIHVLGNLENKKNNCLQQNLDSFLNI